MRHPQRSDSDRPHIDPWNEGSPEPATIEALDDIDDSAAPRPCSECGKYLADYPSKRCVGCLAYEEHTTCRG